MQKRLKALRKTLGMTQSDFGKKIGATRDAIAAYERGVLIKEPIIKLICKVYNVDYFWLIDGTGDMFTAFPETIIDEVIEQFELDEGDKAILQAYVKMTDGDRKAVKNFLLSIAENANKKSE